MHAILCMRLRDAWRAAKAMLTSVCGVAKKKTPKKYHVPTEIRRLARERVGAVPAPKTNQPNKLRKKPKHKRPPEEEIEP